MVSQSRASRTSSKNSINAYIRRVNQYEKIGEYFTPDDVAKFVAKAIESVTGQENNLSILDPMSGSGNLMHEVLWYFNDTKKIDLNSVYLNRFNKQKKGEENSVYESKNDDSSIYGTGVWGQELQKNISKIDINTYDKKSDLVIVNLDVNYLGKHRVIQELTNKYCFILDTNSPRNNIDWNNVGFSIEKVIDLGNGVGVLGKRYYLYVYSKKEVGVKNFGDVFYTFSGGYTDYKDDIFREKKNELMLGNKSFDELIEKTSLEQVSEEILSIESVVSKIQYSNKILNTNFSKLLGSLSISWIPEIEEQITEIIKSIQNTQKIESKKLYEILIALTVSNFLILSGPSGVGKTSLVSKLSDELGGQFSKFPIKSNFTDESGLLGYWNPLLSRYEGTEVLNFIFRSSLGENKHIPFFLLLDEMNLSRIENYFSEFLSRIDEIRTTRTEIKLFEVLIDNESKLKNIKYFIEKYNLNEEQVTVINGSFEDLIKVYKPNEIINLQVEVKINLYSNFHIIGTINEDETTNSISNKVLDRAFYITLGVDDLFRGKETADINIKDVLLEITNSGISGLKNDVAKFEYGFEDETEIEKSIEFEKFIFEKIKGFGETQREVSNAVIKRVDILQDINLHFLDKKIKIIYEIKTKFAKHNVNEERYLQATKSLNGDLLIIIFNEPIDYFEYKEKDSILYISSGYIFDFLYNLQNYNNESNGFLIGNPYQDITQKNTSILNDLKAEISEEIQRFINEINTLIQEINKNDAIGYRALEDMMTFMKNYKYNVKSFEEKKILDLVLCQKVWPKIKNYSIIGEKDTKFEVLKRRVGEFLGNDSESYKLLSSLNLF